MAALDTDGFGDLMKKKRWPFFISGFIIMFLQSTFFILRHMYLPEGGWIEVGVTISDFYYN